MSRIEFQIDESNVPKPHKAWHSRGYLPHFDAPEKIQSLTIRLADAIPKEVADRLSNEKDKIKRYKTAEYWLDQGTGACHLRKPKIARLVENAFLHFDNERYRMLGWVIMPNHVHCVFETLTGFPLADLLHSWKSFTSHEVAKLIDFDPPFWFSEYFDRFVRDRPHLDNVISYIHENPVEAGLCEDAREWRWSSAFADRVGETTKISMPDGSFR